jgi:site-specific recombinase XerD
MIKTVQDVKDFLDSTIEEFITTVDSRSTSTKTGIAYSQGLDLFKLTIVNYLSPEKRDQKKESGESIKTKRIKESGRQKKKIAVQADIEEQKSKESTHKAELAPSELLKEPIEDIFLNGYRKTMVETLSDYAPASKQLYTTAISNYLEFITGRKLIKLTIPEINLVRNASKTRNPNTFQQFHRDEIEKVIEYTLGLSSKDSETDGERLRNYRDQALILTLADTGLRIHEACKMIRGDLEINEGRAKIKGKGSYETYVRFSPRALNAITNYYREINSVYGTAGRFKKEMPIFIRHDWLKKELVLKSSPLSTEAARNIIKLRVEECLGDEMVGIITPHTFRHYFVTIVLNATGNLRITQELARHKNIATTERYTHLSNDELDKAYYESIVGEA